MPLVPRYSWSETPEKVSIQVHDVPIKDQSQLLVGDVVVKLAAPPYLLLLDLQCEVDEACSHATIQGGTLHLSLQKVGACGIDCDTTSAVVCESTTGAGKGAACAAAAVLR
jgi:hypothetical protein